jgi:hypothetical protein
MSDFNKWGTTSSRMRHPDVDGWRIETELFTCRDGETYYRVKKAKNDFSFDSPSSSYMLWVSAPPRKRKKFQTREAALDWAIGEING